MSKRTTTIEAMMLIAQDTKKDFSHNKPSGTWSWFDRDERDNLDAHHEGFPSFSAALTDAVAPYLEDDKDEEPAGEGNITLEEMVGKTIKAVEFTTVEGPFEDDTCVEVIFTDDTKHRFILKMHD